jgi:hypothetical protein
LILVSDFEGLKETDGCRGYQYQNLEIWGFCFLGFIGEEDEIGKKAWQNTRLRWLGPISFMWALSFHGPRVKSVPKLSWNYQLDTETKSFPNQGPRTLNILNLIPALKHFILK